jgi:hypothetical protein
MALSSVAPNQSSMNSIGQSISEKLSRGNFIFWKAQVLVAIWGARLYRYLDGMTTAPSKEIQVQQVDNTSKAEENPAYAACYAQDKQLLSFLLNSVTKEVLRQVATETSAVGAWHAILRMFSS